MRKPINFLLKFNGVILVAIGLITLIFSLRLGTLEMKEDEETFISKNSPVLKQYREFQKTFEANEAIIVAYESPNIFSEGEIKYLLNLQVKLEKLPGVIEVNSLINADNINGVEGGIEIFPIVDTTDLSQENLEKASKLVKGNNLFEGVFISNDQKVASIIVDFPGMFSGGSDSLSAAFYYELVNLVENERKESGRDLHLGGDIVTDASIERLMDRDLSILFPVSLLLSALILFFFFRKRLTTLVPLLPVIIAIMWVLGLKGWTGIPLTPISITLFPLIMVIGLANSIHIISHYQKIRPTSESNYDAIVMTLNAVLKPCFLAAFTTAIGFGSLAISDVTGIKQMGVFAAFGIMSAFFLSITIIPFTLKRSKIFQNEKQKIEKGNILDPILQRIDKLNHNHPWKIILLFATIIIISILFIPKINVEGSMASFAKENTRLRKDIRFIDENMSGINSYELVLRGEDEAFKNPEILKTIDEISSKISQNPNVLKHFSVADLLKSINKALHNDDNSFQVIPNTESEVAQYLFLYEISGGEELTSFVDETYSVARITFRTCQMSNKEQNEFLADLKQIAESNLENIDWEVTGFGMLMNHINENLISTQIESIVMALGVILLLMFLMFGIKGGLLSILPNLFPIVFFMGLMGIFGIDLNMATSIIASVTIGIVVDDTIHFFFGYKKEMEKINNPVVATSTTIKKIGTALCITSFILVLGFGILLLSSSKFISDFGIMSASAIAAALLGDLFISPITLLKSKLFLNKI